MQRIRFAIAALLISITAGTLLASKAKADTKAGAVAPGPGPIMQCAATISSSSSSAGGSSIPSFDGHTSISSGASSGA